MTDLSSTLDGILQKHNARLAQHRRSISDITDEFLKDAYQIQSHISSLHSYLRSIRGPYLSTTNAPPRGKRASQQSSHHQQQQQQQYLTTTQRDSIDAESKGTLRDLSGAIGRLAATETQRREIRRQLAVQRAAKRFPLGALGRWAAGDGAVAAASSRAVLTPEEQRQEDAEKTTDAWRDAVLWFLRARLGNAAEVQRDMMERRVHREMEKSLSVLYKTKGASGGGPAAADHGGSGGISGTVGTQDITGLVNGDGAIKQKSKETALAEDKQGTGASGDAANYGLTPEQLQLFAEENSAMLKHYEDSLDQVRAAERSMVEISELQTTLAANLSIQSERIDGLVEDSQRTEENVTGGNKELKQATEKWRPAKMFFWATCGLSGFLILWDLVI